MSFGLRALSGIKEQLAAVGLNLEELDKFVLMAEAIEGFWSKPENQRVDT